MLGWNRQCNKTSHMGVCVWAETCVTGRCRHTEIRERRACTRVGQAGCTQGRKSGWWGSSLAWEKSRAIGWGQIASTLHHASAKGNAWRALSWRVQVWLSSSSSCPTTLTHIGSHPIPKTCQAFPLYLLLVLHSVVSHHPDLSLFHMANPLFPGFSFRLRRSSWPSTYLSFTTIHELLHSTYHSGNWSMICIITDTSSSLDYEEQKQHWSGFNL